MRRVDAVYKRVRGCEIGATLYQGAAQPRATVMWIHGGALVMGGREDLETAYAHELRFLMELGLDVVSVDYRLAPESVLPDILEDVIDAYYWILNGCGGLMEKHPKKICLVGHSAGGYLSLLLGAMLEDKPRALVSFYGYGDILGDWLVKPSEFYCGFGEISHADAHAHMKLQPIISNCVGQLWGFRCTFYFYLRQKGSWAQTVNGLNAAEKDLAALKEFCPIEIARANFPPAFFAHGAEDSDVPFQQSQAMKAKLDEMNVPTCLWAVKNGPHCFSLDEQWRSSEESGALMSAIQDFLQAHVL